MKEQEKDEQPKKDEQEKREPRDPLSLDDDPLVRLLQ